MRIELQPPTRRTIRGGSHTNPGELSSSEPNHVRLTYETRKKSMPKSISEVWAETKTSKDDELQFTDSSHRTETAQKLI